ncbi:MAG: hypothetical protein M3373_11735 [Gemmatimonadota bacterium]|nr:hypothetical protein [Gemmatimonadota bacterium]
MGAIAGVTLLAAAYALATWVFGWLGVPLVAAAWGLVARASPDATRQAAFAAAAGWAILLAWQSTRGPVGTVAATLGRSMALPTAAVVILTLLFAAALAWSAATVARGLAWALRPARAPGHQAPVAGHRSSVADD